MSKPGAKEIARFLGKRSGRLELWGLLPAAEHRRYPSVLTLKGDDWRQNATRVFGEEVHELLEVACRRPIGEWATLHGVKTNERLRICKGDHGTTQLQILPLVRLTDMVRDMIDTDRNTDIISILTAKDETPWTAATDKLAQMEYYYAIESTDGARRCGN